MSEYEECDAQKHGRYDAAVEVNVAQKNGARQLRQRVLYRTESK